MKLFLSDETYVKFGGIEPERYADSSGSVYDSGACKVPALVPGVEPPLVLYQDEHILLFYKPSGMLSQKAGPDDISLVEYLQAYLLTSGSMTREQLQLVRPSVCNRLDRNTSGIVIAGLSLPGLQTMNRLLKERTIRKYYRCIVCGTISRDSYLHGYLRKDSRTNTVTVSQMPEADAKLIETSYHVIASANGLTLLEVHLITGRSHQIRAHLSSIGHPILGDPKYGDEKKNRAYAQSVGLHSQLLHAYRLEFPEIDGPLSYLSGKSFCAPMPDLFSMLFPVSEANA